MDEAVSWYQRVLTVDPRDKEAYYSLGVIDWMKWYPNLMRARAQLGMRPEQPGPLSNAAVRQELLARYSPMIADGIANLEKALEIDPQYDDAMAYINLLIRERADLRSTREEYRRDVDVADQWVGKALAAKRSRASTATSQYAPPPPPPPPPPPLATPQRIIVGREVQHGPSPPFPVSNKQTPQRIRVTRDVQEAKLIRKVDPVYPSLAKQASIQGTVRFTAIVGKDGQVQNLTLISGHPLLIESARTAVMQWVYRPTLLNYEPVEVVTEIDVSFTLK